MCAHYLVKGDDEHSIQKMWKRHQDFIFDPQASSGCI